MPRGQSDEGNSSNEVLPNRMTLFMPNWPKLLSTVPSHKGSLTFFWGCKAQSHSLVHSTFPIPSPQELRGPFFAHQQGQPWRGRSGYGSFWSTLYTTRRTSQRPHITKEVPRVLPTQHPYNPLSPQSTFALSGHGDHYEILILEQSSQKLHAWSDLLLMPNPSTCYAL